MITLLIDWMREVASILGLIWLSLIACVLYRSIRRRYREAIVPGVLAIALWALTGTSLPAHLVASLERPYAVDSVETLPEADAIIVLGGTMIHSSSDAFGINVVEAFDRVLMGLDLAKRGKAPLLICGGGGYPIAGSQYSESKAMQAWLEGQLKAGKAPKIVALPVCGSTRDEAVRTTEVLSPENSPRILLVSSAFHLYRASALFTAAGYEVVPVGCDFTGLSRVEDGPYVKASPRNDHWDLWELYFHEAIGRVYYKLRGWI